jgi:hypothetical protein
MKQQFENKEAKKRSAIYASCVPAVAPNARK